MAANTTVAKLAAAVPLLIIIIILPCVLPACASRTVSPLPEDVIDDNAPTTTTETNLPFLPIRGGVVMVNNKTARTQDDCDYFCTDEKCRLAYPDRCGPHPDPNYCWVGCLCTPRYNFCTCLCTAA